MKTLEKFLYLFGSKRTFDKNGIKTYNRMYECLSDISILTEISIRDICRKLDEKSHQTDPLYSYPLSFLVSL